MKGSLLAFAVLGTIGFSTLATAIPGSQTLVTAKLSSGFVPPNRSYSIDCTITEHNVYLKTRRGDNPVVIYKNIVVDNTGLKDLITAAASGVITSRHAPADIGNRVYTAYQYVSEGKTLTIDLGSVRDSQSITENQAKEASVLKAIADKYCEVNQ